MYLQLMYLQLTYLQSHIYKNTKQFQSSIVDNGRDYVLHYVGMPNMHIFYFFCPQHIRNT
jgi:hypothetical protein